MVASPKKKKPTIDPFDIYVGGQLAKARIGCGESREQLAVRWGMTFQQVQKYEKGLNKLSHRRVYDASKFYDQPLSYFTQGFTEKKAVTMALRPLLDAREERGSFRVAQLFNKLTDDTHKKAVFALLNTFLAGKKGKSRGQ